MIRKGRVHSFQTLGTLDGPGVRFVVFLQGCNLRCKCCHNPDTWDVSGGEIYGPTQIVEKAARYKGYFGEEGGITLSGGEPLLQAEFAGEVFRLCHKEGINTCLDTSGNLLDDNVKKLLEHTDIVLLDLKYTCDELYRENAGCSIQQVMRFLEYLNGKNIPTVLRQVIIPTVNDDEENIIKLMAIAGNYTCVDKIELLPFKKICQIKYDQMKIPFPFGNLPVPEKNKMEQLKKMLSR